MQREFVEDEFDEKDIPLTGFNPKYSVSNSDISNDEEKLLSNLAKKNSSKIDDKIILEFLKCRANPLYFINNYIYLDEIGGSQLYSSELMNRKFRRVAKVLNKYHKAILMASRQLGKENILPNLIIN